MVWLRLGNLNAVSIHLHTTSVEACHAAGSQARLSSFRIRRMAHAPRVTANLFDLLGTATPCPPAAIPGPYLLATRGWAFQKYRGVEE